MTWAIIIKDALMRQHKANVIVFEGERTVGDKASRYEMHCEIELN